MQMNIIQTTNEKLTLNCNHNGPVVQRKADRILVIGLDQILKIGCSKGKEGI